MYVCALSLFSALQHSHDSSCAIPTISIVAAAAGIVHQLLLRFSVRSIRHKEALVDAPISFPDGGKYDGAKAQDSSITLLPELRSNGRTEAIEMTEGKQRYNEGPGLRLRGERQ